MKKIAIVALLLLYYNFGCHQKTQNRLFPGVNESKKMEKSVTESQPITEKTNIHFNKNYCTECHILPPTAGEKNQLKYEGDFKLLCKCHYSAPEKHSHPMDITPSKDMKMRIPANFPLKEGKVTCSTCHDIFVQCQENQKAFQMGEMFLRETPLDQKNRMCYKCHDKSKYQMYTPHKQRDEKRNMIAETCLYCHSEIPDVDTVTYKDTKFLMRIELLCIRCHMNSNKNSLHDKHIRKPSPEVATKIKQTEKQFNIILPLTADGKLTCATCHNPHEEGLIPADRASAKGASKKYRHRLPGNLCIKCHEMKVITSHK
ncbi:MAG: hypothetical protein C0403_01140 [Desulfobacterium sp.]|nr:hypothetical protein [Desulfobacterium sp.]